MIVKLGKADIERHQVAAMLAVQRVAKKQNVPRVERSHEGLAQRKENLKKKTAVDQINQKDPRKKILKMFSHRFKIKKM